MPEWESVNSPRDARFIGWGMTPGQFVEGKVLNVGTGLDINDNTVPELTIELTAPAASFTKGERTDFEAGTTVVLTCGQSNLKKNVTAANLAPGDLVRIELESLYPTPKGKAKIFDVKVARGAGGPVTPRETAPAQQSSFGAADFDDAPPF